jgi:asparagine synthetase B (glutamine-hydrolysing)
LVYWFSGNRLLFASHEFGLIKSGLVKSSLHEEKLVDSLFRHNEIYAQTVFQNVCKVMPGHSVTFSAGQEQGKKLKYWNPGIIKKNKILSFECAVSRLQELIVTATRSRIEPGKTGLHVSGGLDSCGVSSIVADHTPDKSLLTGYSWTPEIFEDKVEGVNEKEFINAFSVDKKVLVKYLNLDEFETVKNAILPEFEIQHIEHPVMQMAGKDGIETLFSGWGGDEFISLSTRGTVNHLFFSLKWFALLKYIKKNGIKSSIYQFRKDVFPLLVPFGLLPVYKTGYTDWSTLRLLKPLLSGNIGNRYFYIAGKTSSVMEIAPGSL